MYVERKREGPVMCFVVTQSQPSRGQMAALDPSDARRCESRTIAQMPAPRRNDIYMYTYTYIHGGVYFGHLPILPTRVTLL